MSRPKDVMYSDDELATYGSHFNNFPFWYIPEQGISSFVIDVLLMVKKYREPHATPGDNLSSLAVRT